MSPAVFAWAAAALVGAGLFATIIGQHPLRRLLGINVLGCGIFLAYGVIARRGAAAGLQGDPVPHALVITGVVVAFAATAVALALLRRWAELATEEAEPGASETVGPGDAA